MNHQSIPPSKKAVALARRAMVSIVLFGLSYLLLLGLVLSVTLACIWAGGALIWYKPQLVTVITGVGLAAFGLFLLVYMMKFLFRKEKKEEEKAIEVHPEDQPALFAMIDDIVKKTGTNFPHKVYLNHEVNASVSIHTGYRSILYPRRKYLTIGMGLINSVTATELKAVLAHEFGHFSQKSMRVGVYVHQANYVIYDMVHNKGRYQASGDRKGIMGFLVHKASYVTGGIRWIQSKWYHVINRNFMALSREMEFHADTIAASVTGYEPLSSALLRLAFASHAMSEVLNLYEYKGAQALTSTNLYAEQEHLAGRLAAYYQMPLRGSFADVGPDFIGRFRHSLLVFKDQWASHPELMERIERLEQSGFTAKEASTTKANSLLHNLEALQEQLTDMVFAGVRYNMATSKISFEEFVQLYRAYFEEQTYDQVFNGYYDEKHPPIFDLDEPMWQPEGITAAELFAPAQVAKVHALRGLQEDIGSLSAIAANSAMAQSFDYAGQRYQQKDAAALLSRLNEELKELNSELIDNDFEIYAWCLHREEEIGERPLLKTLYRQLYQMYEWQELSTDLQTCLQFISQTTPYEQIVQNMRVVKVVEKKMKEFLLDAKEMALFDGQVDPGMFLQADRYLAAGDMPYYTRSGYINEQILLLSTAVSIYIHLAEKGQALAKKHLTDYKASLAEAAPVLG